MNKQGRSGKALLKTSDTCFLDEQKQLDVSSLVESVAILRVRTHVER